MATTDRSKASTKAVARTVPKWQHAPEVLAHTFQQILEAFPQAVQRKMFGYPAAFINGRMFTGLHQNNMILRLSDEDRVRFLQLKDAYVFEPMPGRPMHEYVVVPTQMIEDRSTLLPWLEKSFAYASALPSKAPKAKPVSKRAKR